MTVRPIYAPLLVDKWQVVLTEARVEAVIHIVVQSILILECVLLKRVVERYVTAGSIAVPYAVREIAEPKVVKTVGSRRRGRERNTRLHRAERRSNQRAALAAVPSEPEMQPH